MLCRLPQSVLRPLLSALTYDVMTGMTVLPNSWGLIPEFAESWEANSGIDGHEDISAGDPA